MNRQGVIAGVSLIVMALAAPAFAGNSAKENAKSTVNQINSINTDSRNWGRPPTETRPRESGVDNSRRTVIPKCERVNCSTAK